MKETRDECSTGGGGGSDCGGGGGGYDKGDTLKAMTKEVKMKVMVLILW